MAPTGDRGKFTKNFLYGAQASRQKGKCSLWSPRKPAKAKPKYASQQTSTGETQSQSDYDDEDDLEHTPSSGRMENTMSTPAPRRHGSHHRTRLRTSTNTALHPFSKLATTVKQCPWMLGSDLNPTASDHPFYPPVPRSLVHDTAVSFVVTDHTRPEQPQFVLSCPLEHVDWIQQLLAPEGSDRVLSARGSSGFPRGGGELRSMLLDGTPCIELALHRGEGGSNGKRNADVGGTPAYQPPPAPAASGRTQAEPPVERIGAWPATVFVPGVPLAAAQQPGMFGAPLGGAGERPGAEGNGQQFMYP